MTTTEPELSSDFARYVTRPLATSPVKPLIVQDINDKQLSFLFQHEVTTSGRKKAFHMMKDQDHCNTCSERFRSLHAVSDLSGSIFSCFDNISSEYIHHKNYSQIADFSKSNCKKPICGLILLQNPTVMGYEEEVGGFHHITRLVNPSDITTCDDSTRIALIVDCIPRYLTSGLFERLVLRLVPQGKDSLNLMKTCLDKAPYGNKFIPAVNWCEAILNDLETHSKKWEHFSPKEKISFAIYHIIRAGLAKDSAGSVAMLFQTAYNNIIGLLEDAKSESAMTNLCAERLDPSNYQRRTVDATPGQIANAIKHLGDFTNSIMNEAQAKELIPEMVFHGQSLTTEQDSESASLTSPTLPTSSMTGFKAQLDKIQKPEVPTSFASRCGKSSIDVEIKNIKTLRDFVDLTRKNPDLKVEISGTSSVAYVASTTLDKDKIAHRHLWGFMNGFPASSFGLSNSWTEVSHTIPMYEYITGYKSVIFVTPAINKMSNFRNCCFPEFLTPEFRRACGSAFEGLNSTTKIAIPDGQLMAGFGTSIKDNAGKLHSPVNLRVNGICITLQTL